MMFFSIASAWASDPMRPPAWLLESNYGLATKSAKEISQFSLQQILISKNKKIAVVNGSVMTEGAKLGNAKLLKIYANKIRMKTSKGIEILELNPHGGVKKL